MVVASRRSAQRAVRFRSPSEERAEAMLASVGQLALVMVLWPLLLGLRLLQWAERGVAVVLGIYFGLLQVSGCVGLRGDSLRSSAAPWMA